MKRKRGQQVSCRMTTVLLAACLILQSTAMAGAQGTSSPTTSAASVVAPAPETATAPSSEATAPQPASDTQDGSPPTATTASTSAPTAQPTAARTATNAPTAATASSAPAPPPLSFKDAIAAEYKGHQNVSWVAAIVILVVIAVGITGCCVCYRRRQRAKAARFTTLRDQELAFKSDAFDI